MADAYNLPGVQKPKQTLPFLSKNKPSNNAPSSPVLTKDVIGSRVGGGNITISKTTPKVESKNVVIDTLQKGAEGLSNTALNTLAPLTSKESVLRLTEQLKEQSSIFENDVVNFNTQALLFNLNYQDKALSENDYKQAQFKQIQLENKEQALQKKQYNLEQLRNKLINKSKVLQPIEKNKQEAIPFTFENLGQQILKQTDILPLAIYQISQYPEAILKPNTKPITIKEEIEGFEEQLPGLILSAGIAKGASKFSKFVFEPKNIELIKAPKITTASGTLLQTGESSLGTLTKANVLLESVKEPPIYRITSRVERAIQKIENIRADILNIEPKVYGDILTGKPQLSGAIAKDIFFLNGKQINQALFFSKSKGAMTRVNELLGGISEEIPRSLVDKMTKETQELVKALSESRYGIPNFEVLDKKRMINLGYQEAKELARLTNPRMITGDFGGIKVSQRRPLVKPTSSGKTTTRANIAGIIDELNLKLQEDIKVFRESFVGKDVTYPYKKGKPFQIEGIVIEKRVGLPKEKGYTILEPSGKTTSLESLQALYREQILRELQISKGQIASKLVKGFKEPPSAKAILKQNQASFEKELSKGAYSGMGLYERTSETSSILSLPEQKLVMSNLSEVIKDNINQFVNQITNFNEKSITRASTKTIDISREIEREITREQPKQTARENIKEIERELLREIARTTELITPKSVPKESINKPFVFNIPPKREPEERKSKSKSQQGYNVFGKAIKSNKFFQINHSPLTHQRAKDIGAYYVTQSLARTFNIKKSNKPAQEDYEFISIPFGYYNSQEYKLRNYRIKNKQNVAFSDERFIQKAIYGLSSQAEKKQIQDFRKQVRSILR